MSTNAPLDAERATPFVNGVGRLLRGLRASAGVAAAIDREIDRVAARLASRAYRRRAEFEIVIREAAPSVHAADIALADRALQGDPAAARAIRDQIEGLIVGRIHAQGLGAHEDELVGLAMSHFWRKLPRYAGKASLRTWAWTVTDRFLFNWMRDTKLAAQRFPSL